MYRPSTDNDPALELARETHRLGVLVERLMARDAVFARPWRYLFFSFLNGLFIFLGSTVGVAILLWILNLFGYLPFLGDAAQMIRNTIGQ
jgi:hypothetical protein